MSKRLQAVSEESLYRCAMVKDRTEKTGPLSLAIAAISGKLHSFKCLLNATDWRFRNYGAVDGRGHPYVEKWAANFDDPRSFVKTSILNLLSHLGNEAMVTMMLEKVAREEGTDKPYPSHCPSMYDYNCSTPLYRAARMGHVGTIQILISAGGEVDEEICCSTPLSYAVAGEHIAAVEFLIGAGADVSSASEFSPLIRACRQGNQEIVNILLESGARENIDIALCSLVCGDNLSMMRLLVDAGARVWPLQMGRVAVNGNLEILRLLMGHGSKFDREINATVLHYGKCLPEVTQLVLNEVPELAKTRDSDGLMPLDTVYQRYPLEEEIITQIGLLLIKYGGEITAPIPNRYPALMSAVALGHERMVRALLELESQKPSISWKGPDGRTALHYVCVEGTLKNKTIAELLINSGIDLDTQENGGQTSLHLAASAGACEIFTLLLGAGADPFTRDTHGETALHKAAREAMHKHKRVQGHTSLLGSIILGDLNVTLKDVGGGKRLEPLMRTGYARIMRELVIAGVDVSLQNKYGYTALDIVAEYRLPRMTNPLYGNKKFEDMKGAGRTEATRDAILQWITPEEYDGLDGINKLGEFWDGVEE
ncbi:hypothetical protein FQN54_008613 [Arachnomyces sp. PD_36]|nr:hypothetical protein FQN54_008613 [Arachnomyces sp. PD_36]